MIDSPWPVHETATVASSAHVPAPISGSRRRGRAAGRTHRRSSRGREAALGVTGDGADRAAGAGGIALLERDQREPLALGDEPRLVLEVEPGGGGELDRRGPTSSTWRPSSSTARAARTGLRTPRTAATAPAARWRAVHDRGVELDAAVLGQRGAAAGVELGVVLEHDDRRLDGVERAPPSASTACPASTAAAAPARMRSARSGSAIAPPAPPWTTIAISSIGQNPSARSRPRPPTRDAGEQPVARGIELGLDGSAAVRAPAEHDVGRARRAVDAEHVDVELPGHERPHVGRGAHAAARERGAPAGGASTRSRESLPAIRAVPEVDRLVAQVAGS